MDVSIDNALGEVEQAPLVQHETGLWMRRGSRDALIISERGQYLAVHPTPDDVLLDVGANIGAVSAAFLDAGVSKVVALEPEPANYDVLNRNLAGYGSRAVSLNMAAAVTSGVRALWISDSRNRGLHSLVQHRGRGSILVPSIALLPLLRMVEPTLLKIDIEGGEYELAPILGALPTTVRGVTMELHLWRKEWRDRSSRDLVHALNAQGFSEQGSLKITRSNRGTVGTWLR